jgi:hypothetical protein
VRVVSAPAQADVVLQSLGDTRERSVVAQTSAAQVREMQLRLRFLSARHALGRELLPAPILLLARDMSYSETQALAKELEEAELFREMQSDVVLQVLRRLSAMQALRPCSCAPTSSRPNWPRPAAAVHRVRRRAAAGQEAGDAIRAAARAAGHTERKVFTVSGAHFDWSA